MIAKATDRFVVRIPEDKELDKEFRLKIFDELVSMGYESCSDTAQLRETVKETGCLSSLSVGYSAPNKIMYSNQWHEELEELEQAQLVLQPTRVVDLNDIL